jgi:hypothetical protein
MSDVNSMVILPNDLVENEYETQTGMGQVALDIPNLAPEIKNRKNDFMSKQIRILKIALNLAKIDGFNEDLNIKKIDGTYNENSNLAQLLNITQNKVKINPGIEDLIYQMKKAKINPNLIINEIIKSKLGVPKSDIFTQTEINPQDVPLPMDDDDDDDNDDDNDNNINNQNINNYQFLEKAVGTENTNTKDTGVGPELNWINTTDSATETENNNIETNSVASGSNVGTSYNKFKGRSMKSLADKPTTKRHQNSAVFWDELFEKKRSKDNVEEEEIDLNPSDSWIVP